MKVIKHKDKWYLQSETGYKEILLSTDLDLILDGVQAIDDEFLEWFIKNPSCEEVEVLKYKSNNMHKMNLGYKPIIPKEEPKREFVNTTSKWDMEDFEELKQETLEEAAERLTYHDTLDWENTLAMESFKLGAKWQMERSYSEKDLKEYGEFCVAKFNGYESVSLNEEILNEFKKK